MLASARRPRSRGTAARPRAACAAPAPVRRWAGGPRRRSAAARAAGCWFGAPTRRSAPSQAAPGRRPRAAARRPARAPVFGSPAAAGRRSAASPQTRNPRVAARRRPPGPAAGLASGSSRVAARLRRSGAPSAPRRCGGASGAGLLVRAWPPLGRGVLPIAALACLITILGHETVLKFLRPCFLSGARGRAPAGRQGASDCP